MLESVLKIICLCSLVGALYSYLIYPFILLIIKKKAPSSSRVADADLPKVSLIIAVHNEEKRIVEKLQNILQLDYPRESLEVIICSDGSTDNTEGLVKDFSSDGVILIDVKEHKGKENAQLAGIEVAQGDIFVFSDVATKMEAGALRRLVSYFDQPHVGAVSSEDRFVNDHGEIAGEGVYVRYEMWLRRQESLLGGLVGLSGSFFAARRVVCNDWDIYSPSDFNTALSCARNHLKAVSMTDVYGIYTNLADPSKEYQRKIRTLIRGFTAVSRHSEILNPFKYGLFSFQIWGHKIMRWLVPWFLLAFLISSSLLFNEGIPYQLALGSQILLYLAALIGSVITPLRRFNIFSIPYFFVSVNLAIAQATLLFLSGKRMYTWKPSKR